MKLTTKGRYGLRVMLELALNEGQGPVLVDKIARNQDISGHYIHVLVTALRKARLVSAVRGPNGGYELIKDPRHISIMEIICWASWTRLARSEMATPSAETMTEMRNPRRRLGTMTTGS